MQTTFTVQTKGPGLYEFTTEVAAWVAGQGEGLLTLLIGPLTGSGLLTLFIRHTSASLLIQENADPEVQTDLTAYFDRLVPPSDDPSMHYLTHTYEGPDDMPAHIKAAMMPVSLQIPILGGRSALGTWQGIYVVEHRRRPHRRDVAAMLLKA